MARAALTVRSLLRPALLPAVLGLLPACATGDGMQEKLRDATMGYNRSVRWSDLDRAAQFLPKVAQPAFLAHHDEIGEQLVIVDYELTRLDLDKQTGIAASRAEISWHTERRLILETTSVDQVWQWHEGQFVLVDERRSGGTPLAIFAEPGEDPHPYLPGLETYRQTHEIGVDERTQRKHARQRRRQARTGAPASPARAPVPAGGDPMAATTPPDSAAAVR